MLKLWVEIFGLLNSSQRRDFLLLQVLVVFMAILELVSITAIGPFMALIGNLDILKTNNLLARIYHASGINNPNDFIFFSGLLVFFILTISSIFSMFTLWRVSMFAGRTGTELGDRLFEFYTHKPWLFHTMNNSADLTAKIVSTTAVTHEVIQPMANVMARLVTVIFIATPMLFFNPKVAIAGLTVFSVAYLILYRVARKKLLLNGVSNANSSSNRYTLMSETFGGIKDVLLMRRQYSFTHLFYQEGKKLADCLGNNHILVLIPRYIMELIAVGLIIFLVLYLVTTHAGELGNILPILSLYALGGFKLLPAFQNIYGGLAQIKGNIGYFYAIKDDLKMSQTFVSPYTNTTERQSLQPIKSIELKNIYFTYPNKSTPALVDFNIHIPVNTVIGLVGSSGSGKSTAIDLLLGFIQPDSGELLIDGKPLTSPAELCSWQDSLGFVPQSIFLANTSILKNIAFGLLDEEIDLAKAHRAIKLAHLEDYIKQLPDGLHTQVGERGVQLSGGQRQRIGIARALYNDPAVLILDEATSALDGITEKIIMDAIHDFSGNKTIIMVAHRLTTVQQCDRIFFMANGKVIDKGTYRELLERNDTFRQMAAHADSQ